MSMNCASLNINLGLTLEYLTKSYFPNDAVFLLEMNFAIGPHECRNGGFYQNNKRGIGPCPKL